MSYFRTSVNLVQIRHGLHFSAKHFKQPEVKLTKDVYKVKRGNYSVLDDSHIKKFENILSEDRVLTDAEELDSYNTDWIKMVRGYSGVVLRPKSTEEVSAILRVCNENNLAVCPQGGNTGLVGGSVPVFDEVIISTSLMNKIIKINDIPGSIVCQAGCVLETLDNALAEHGLMMPLDLGAKGSCHIGGNIATNAGGLRLLRYGSLQANTLGLVAVKADGQVIDCMNTLKKDNTGYHLKHLFIGSEGTLGLVTEVAIQCPPKPQSVSLALLGVVDFDHALKTFRLARSMLSEILSSCELIDENCMQPVVNTLGVRNPLSEHPFYVLIEVSGSNAAHDEEKLNAFLESAMEDEIVADGTVTNEPSRMQTIWQLRERIAEALLRNGFVYKYDVSLPHNSFYQLIPVLQDKLKGTDAKIVSGYGHLGDGNLHLNICAPQFSPELLAKIEPFVYEWISERGGSISAEHGIGFKKTKFLRYSKSDAAIHTMRQIKQLMDPKGILNPYKVLPME
ncbi:D-2-hydroxyglutarate dehydrogenase, mitochondrial-like [Macrosteles quadrilineatus]|uniref:D-2-hydroxyglutarate dehydrogenase, mitochondrial-like n=1 Tax=Macrosteles quadrilineatus TaxID=74068 RepID=UPI0023E0A42B|nr:D-2-hydroxyglutarate dehydrogenase, mitochondrial-like [Macrosteles quadrilineatus]